MKQRKEPRKPALFGSEVASRTKELRKDQYAHQKHNDGKSLVHTCFSNLLSQEFTVRGNFQKSVDKSLTLGWWKQLDIYWNA